MYMLRFGSYDTRGTAKIKYSNIVIRQAKESEKLRNGPAQDKVDHVLQL